MAQCIESQGVGSNGSVKTKDNFHTVPLDDDRDSTTTIQSINNKWQLQDPTDLMSKTQDISVEKHEKTRDNDKLSPPFKFAGCVGTIGSAFCFSLGVLCIRLLPVEDTLQEKTKACMYRGIFLMLFCGTTIIAQGSSFKIPREELLLNFNRSVLGFFGNYGNYVAIQYITIGEASALTYSSPIWTCVLSYFILGEKLPATLALAMPMGAIAIILIAHPELLINANGQVSEELERTYHHVVPKYINAADAHHQLVHLPSQADATSSSTSPDTTELFFDQRFVGVLVALATSVIISFLFIMTKFVKKTPIQTCTFYLGAATVISSVAIQSFIGFGAMPASLVEWLLLVGVGFSSYLAQSLFQWALRYENASTLSVVRTVEIVMSFTYSALFLNEEILWTSLLGALMIMLIVAVLMLNDYLKSGLKSMWRRS